MGHEDEQGGGEAKALSSSTKGAMTRDILRSVNDWVTLF